MSSHRLSLAQQIAELEEPAPVDVDPEDEHRGSPAPFEGTTDAREHYVQVGPSALRRLQDSVADPKYEGVKTSRKQLMDDSDSEVASDLEAARETGEHTGQDAEDELEEEEDESDASSSSEREDEGEVNGLHPRTIPNLRVGENPVPIADDLSSTLQQKRVEDRKKGQAVSRQLSLWDNLLDARIRLQKSAVAANRLPPTSKIPDFASDPRCLEAQHALLSEAVSLTDELSLLREGLLAREDGVNLRPRKRRRVSETLAEIDGGDRDWEGLIREVGEDVVGLEHAYHAHLTHTLAKWSAKIAAVAPSALLPSSRSAFSGSRAGAVKTVGAQVDEVLQADGVKLLARTRVRRGKGTRIGFADGEAGHDDDQEDIDMFDDADFYQQLLRDVIDARGGGARPGDDWMAVQRQKKAKKSVDTKASKGRKLRYEVHEKIQNFMVPVPLAGGGWHEAQIDELFASLLGKGFEGAGPITEEMEDVVPSGGALADPPAEVLKGFRVFG
ncbi:TRAUB-domain-containing protein [Artomyces pyxidatus]|uniref:TRAUB-domain-containing protein n=1 Tax=Artomyces pyxidatus TaxID=48021 RepID=A0ACB8SWR5_9AGAM|nr:TRAUB-domain-containing protein [Artomyces pyxidatus]